MMIWHQNNYNDLLILQQAICQYLQSTKCNYNKQISIGSPPKPKAVLEDRVHTSTLVIILNKHIKDIKNKL